MTRTAAADAHRPDPPAAVAGGADFAAAIYGRVTAGRPGNAFLSPLSIRTAVAMTAVGAAGPTAQQMADALRLPPGPVDRSAAAYAALARSATESCGDGCQLDVANAVWAQRGLPFRPAFVERLKTDFAAAAEPADFATAPEPARVRVNGWVAEHTQQTIRDLLPPGSVTPRTRLVVVNAVHFKADWQQPFRANATSDAPFHLDAGHDAAVPMMRHAVTSMPLLQTYAFDAVELPYKGGASAMLIVIPKAVDGLAAIERGLTGDAVRTWVDGLRPAEASLELPKFTATATYNLGPALVAMGMTDAFDPARADFSAMVDGPVTGDDRLCITGVFHKAYVAVDEQGTEAAAATGMVVGAAAMRAGPIVHLVADRPFLFLIRDHRSGLILFMGRCVDPRS